MPVPAILGLASLGGLVSKVVEKAVDFFFNKATRKIFVIGAIMAGIYSALSILFSILGVYIEPLVSGIPSNVTALIGMALPSNTLGCITTIASVESACITYTLTVKTLELQSKVA